MGGLSAFPSNLKEKRRRRGRRETSSLCTVWGGVGQNRSMGKGSLEWKKRGVCRKEEGGKWVVLVGGERGQEEHQK